MYFSGSMVALVTPMHENGSIDKKALHELVEWHIAEKTAALIVAGTTGESATLEANEQFELTSLLVKQAAGRLPIIAGAGTNATQSTLKLAMNAKEAKADGCLIVTPYYNKPTQNGLYEHYKLIAEKISLPIILYNVPSRTACDLLPETIERLAKIKNIVGVKEATGKLDRLKEIIARCGKSFDVYSGDDLTALSFLLNGAKGVISVTANVAPRKMQEMYQAAETGQIELAETINEELMLLHTNLFLESNPIPAKWALHQMGKIPAGIRLPLLPLDSQYHEAIKKAMQQAGVN